jgi:antibiotic biosynthesis monooxygenase (ABM) superfamily enzyme
LPLTQQKELILEVHASRASAVVVQRVPVDAADWFMDWQRGVTAAAVVFPGYRETDIYPPGDTRQDPWVVVIHFDDEKSLQTWLGSPVRDEWVAKLRARAGDFRLKMLPGGLGTWFAGLEPDSQAAPPGWKMVATVVLALFPTVMLITIFVGPTVAPLGLAVGMLLSNFLSVAILQWGVMPVLTRLLAPWLQADTCRRTAFSMGGLVVILLILVVLSLIFRLVTG